MEVQFAPREGDLTLNPGSLGPQTSSLQELMGKLVLRGQLLLYGTEPRAIVVLGHDVGNDLRKLDAELGTRLDALDNYMRSIDTQKIAMNISMASRGRKIGLRNLIKALSMYPDERRLHNGGNDNAYTMVCAVAMVLKHESQTNVGPSRAEQAHSEYSLQDVVNTLYTAETPEVESTIWCTICDRHDHFEMDCDIAVCCYRCKAAGRRFQCFTSHSEERCFRKKANAVVIAQKKAAAEQEVAMKVSGKDSSDGKGKGRKVGASRGAANRYDKK